MPKRPGLKRVMVVGSGPIVIGQAAEFDYAGTQACKALREEGLEVVLVNSNPATIMTDTNIADRVYVEPLTVEFAEKIIAKERPDGLLPTLGGQTGLNLATQIARAGILERYGVELLGTSLEAITRAEDREAFRDTMREIGEPIPASEIVTTLAQAKEVARALGFPVIVRPAYTLGGTGGGIAYNMAQLEEIASRGLHMSMIKQVLLEQCVVGWKEIEYEVMRDGADNCITICNMENFDPMGVHTGDSIVVAPSQTLSDKEYQLLRTASLKIIRALGIEGGCNVQLALDPKSMKYFVIEVNPRVSRSSALASKATGYPIARVAAKIAAGLRLDEITNAVTGKTTACFEPALDYVVVKIPRWPFDKFPGADRRVGTQMKATGEVMAIDRTFEAALMKALRSLETGVFGPRLKELELWSDMEIEECLREPTDERLFAVCEGLRRGMMIEEIAQLSGIDAWFLRKLKGLLEIEREIRRAGPDGLTEALLRRAKQKGFSDHYMAGLVGMTEVKLRQYRRAMTMVPTYKMVDTCAAEFESSTPYYYSCYEEENEAATGDKKRVVVLGSGPIRIGQGIEFDYCSVHSVWALDEEGYESIIINNNPETVSTDFDTSDKLFFEPLSEEDVLNMIYDQRPEGVVVQFGGQTAVNLAAVLHRNGIKILGTTYADIDRAEDRDKFDKIVEVLGIPRPAGRAVTSLAEAEAVAEKVGYPVLVRPSYVLGGRAMEICYSREDLDNYMRYAADVSAGHPVLVDKYVLGKEAEVDAISDGEDVLIPGVMEHIERAGIHSGDSMAVYPPVTLSENVCEKMVDYARQLCRVLRIKGLLNIQFVVDEKEEVYVLEVNPRASRTVPYLSKVTGVPMVNIATKIMLGRSLRDQGYATGLHPVRPYYAVKAPVFSFAKLTEVEVSLGPEMKSTGEIMGVDHDYPSALYKAMVASGLEVPESGALLATISDRDKPEAAALIKGFADLGYKIYATRGTSQYLNEQGIANTAVNKIREGGDTVLDLVRQGRVNLLINTLSKHRPAEEREGARIRRASVEANVPCLTSLDTARALLQALAARERGRASECRAISDLLAEPPREAQARAADKRSA